ncbi:upstream activation factor subunit UAF30-like isoform X2 [Nicotiana tabacum]|uniref:Upstream activation factor subunit UAF30-like isoform X2 n=1 Tax=Nicotiana tabacum TaxID=4097 RepID=A0A1S4BHJ8_TOBAC|nr:upstream activation factor subunit spp27-like isoform X2 [Nicotiana tomentosiformis]XP_016488353.1 PREDICTED: upstream activation factor subunit spp27-like isoform X2 [Nicotiana tabacum]
MVSDSVLVDRLREILKVSDLETTTAGSVRRNLEEEFGVDLNDRKAFIRDQIDLFLRIHVEETPNDDVQEVEEEEQETENVKEEENDDSCSQEEENESDTGTKEKSQSEKMNGEAKKKGGFNKPCALSPQLQKLVGESELGRPEVVKKIWAYIREKNLQNPQNKRKILCDEVLSEIFRAKTIDMFQMNKVLSKHIWPIDEEDGSFSLTHPASQVKSSVKKRLPKQGREEALDEPKQKEKRQKRGGSGFLAPVRLSDALVKFFGNGEKALTRADVIKRIWQYIKENELQDPSDKKTIICDERLKELFQVDSFHGFTVTKLLTAHFIKRED